MEDDEDNVSFLSISDSDNDSDFSTGNIPLTISGTQSEIVRATSPTSSVTSTRSTTKPRSTLKRIAPQPPTSIKKSSSESNMPPSKIGKAIPKSKFYQECASKNLKTNYPKMTAVTTSRPSVMIEKNKNLKVKQSSNYDKMKPLSRSSSREFANLQLIDEPEKGTAVHALGNQQCVSSSNQLTSAFVNPSNFPADHVSYSPVFFTSGTSLSPNIYPTQSMLPPGTGAAAAMAFHPINSSPASTGLHEYVVSSQEQTSIPPVNSLAQENENLIHPGPLENIYTSHPPLRYSLSDPGVNQLLIKDRIERLESLSEEEEERDVDDSVYAEVYEQTSNCLSSKEIKSFNRRNRVSRSDSNVTVAHLYEDILISSRWNIKLTFSKLTFVVMILAFFIPNSAAIIYNFFRLIFGTLFPAYYSYKAVRTKNVKEYVKWMMYWIVFALFTCVETITDVFVSFWFPFYYEIKILMVLWLLSPATKGSSILYRKFVHPWLTRREEEIDDCIAKAKEQGYSTVVTLGTKGVNYATSVIMQTAIKGGGGLVSQLKRSYSASEINEDTADLNRNVKALPSSTSYNVTSDEDDISSASFEPRHRAESESSTTRTRGLSTGRTARANKTKSADVSDVYFHDATDSVVTRRSPRAHDVMSASTGGGSNHQTRRSRTAEVSNYATLPRTASKRAGATKKRQA